MPRHRGLSVRKYFNRLKDFSDRPWYLPLVCFLAFIDLFVIVIPTEGMIVTTSIVRPKRWWLTAFCVTSASAVGAFTLGWVGRHGGEPFVAWLMGPNFFESANWVRMSGWIEQYGFWGLWFIALGPLPAQPAILICALAHMSLHDIFFAVYLGRAPKYFFFSYIATHSPKLFKKFFGDEFEGLQLPWKKNRDKTDSSEPTVDARQASDTE